MAEPTPITGRRRRRGGGGAVASVAIAGFLVILAGLAIQLRDQVAAPARGVRQTILVRRVYRTTVVEETVPAGVAAAPGSSASSSQSTASGPVPLTAAAPVTRTS